ncbi:MAG: ribonuclease VapC [Acidimicrobiia bacterium]
MTVYLDTSSLVKLYVDEPDSDIVAAEAAEADMLVTSVLAYPEFCAMVGRRRREKVISKAEEARLLERFRGDWPSILTIAMDEDLAAKAGQLAIAHGLRGADAVHLASFVRVLETSDDDDVRFRCADDRLTKAARKVS